MEYYEMFPDMKVSRLGFGAMRLPERGQNRSSIGDEDVERPVQASIITTLLKESQGEQIFPRRVH